MSGILSVPVGGRLLFQQDLADVEVWAFAGGRVAVYSARAPHKDRVNEDAMALLPVGADRGLLAVADGAGGMRVAHAASRRALKRLRRAVAEGSHNGWPLREAILEGFDRANAAVSALRGAATTLAVAEVGTSGVSRCYHAGDTPALVVSGKGVIKLKTVDHSPVGYAVEAGVIAEEEAIHHRLRHVISNFLGSPDMRIEVSARVRLVPRDRLLVASDGLFDNLHLEEIVRIVCKGPLLAAARRLVALCRKRMETPCPGVPSKPDDLSFLLYGPDPAPRRAGQVERGG
ncbi:MAG: protein phosphatase 2C domain-containing protein [Planctomycetes bacterium]|nr:protein phosphatase 2C domain-containing protein [Planctomycetota bacterium]